MLDPTDATVRPPTPDTEPRSRRWRSKAQRRADDARARAETARAELDEQRTRDQLTTERAARRVQAAGPRAASVPARGKPAVEDWLTWVMAAIATGVSGQGMWRFSGDVLGLDGPLRMLLFAFIEGAIVISALRARRNMRDNYSAGIDGIAVWALACLTAALSSMDARSLPEAVFRLAAPLVAAWLWERGMAIERHRLRGASSIHWRITPERLLVRLGLAEATDRTAGEVDARRRISRIALAVLRVDDRADASDRKQGSAAAGLRQRIAQAIEHTGLATDPVLQEQLLAEIDALRSAGTLVARQAVARWAQPEEPRALEARRPIVFRTVSRTEEPRPVEHIVRRSFAFVSGPAPAPQVIQRAFAFHPAAPRLAPVRRTFGFRTRTVIADNEPIERDAFVREVAAEIMAAADRNEKWGPDYDAMMARARRSRSWVEKRVREARRRLLRTELRTEEVAA